jgi:hypothetical protein
MMRAPTSVVDTTLAIASGRKQVRAPFKQLPVARSVRADSAPPGVDQCVDGTGQPYSEIPLTGLACAPPHLVQQRQFRERRVPCSHSARSPSAGLAEQRAQYARTWGGFCAQALQRIGARRDRPNREALSEFLANDSSCSQSPSE